MAVAISGTNQNSIQRSEEQPTVREHHSRRARHTVRRGLRDQNVDHHPKSHQKLPAEHPLNMFMEWERNNILNQEASVDIEGDIWVNKASTRVRTGKLPNYAYIALADILSVAEDIGSLGKSPRFLHEAAVQI
mgnify:CR=1 FL=1